MNEIIHAVFERQAALYPEKTAICEQDASITYAALDKRAGSLAAILRGLGLEKQAVAGVLLPPGIGLVSTMLACFKSGLLYMPLDPGAGKRRLRELFRLCSCKVVVTGPDERALLDLLANLDVWPDAILVVDGDKVGIGRKSGNHYIDEAPVFGKPLPEPDPADGNYVFCTSGTTGMGKAIVGSHKALTQFIDWEIKEFGIDAPFRISQLTSITFDAFLRDVFTALSTGATLYIPAAEIRLNSAALIEWLEANRITLVHCVPSLFKLLTKELAASGTGRRPLLPDLKYIIMAGEPLYGKDIAAWHAAAGNHVQLVTLYGTSESTLAKTFHRIGKDGDDPSRVIPVGKAIDGAEILVVNNRRSCRPGELGEVYIKTAFLTKGYYNNPSLTDTIFVQNPLVSEPDIIHRTGDMGRWLANGELEICGRIDDQVKINGIRIDIGEIEQAVLGLDGIREAIVLPYKAGESQQELVCYYVGDQLAEELLKESLQHEIAPGLVPSYFIRFDSFPLTINGKIDKRALPRPRQMIDKQYHYQAAENEVERTLEDIWSKVLGIQHIGRKASFFEMGGNSLKALMVIAKVYKTFGVLIKIDVIFAHRTIERIATVIGEAQRLSFRNIPVLPECACYDISHAQQRLWIQYQTQTAKALYNVASAYSLEGDLDYPAFGKAFRSLIERHEILRTVFLTVDGQAKQRVLPYDETTHGLELVDWSVPGESGYREKETLQRLANHVFDLEKGPLFKAVLIRLGVTRWVFSLTMHHIVSDAWSLEILTNEMFIFYNTYRKNGDNPLQPLRIQYKEYAEWHNTRLSGDRIDAERNYWLAQFQGSTPVLNLPTGLSRPAVMRYDSASLRFAMDTASRSGLEETGLKADATLFMTFLAALNIILSRHSGQNDITIGSPVAGRDHPDLENQVGFYVNTLPIRTRIDREDSFLKFLGKVRAQVLQSLKYQDYPFDQLIADLNTSFPKDRNPLFDVGFTYIKEYAFGADSHHSDLDGLEVRQLDNEFSLIKADLWFKLIDGEDLFVLDIYYNVHLFLPNYVKRLQSDLEVLLEAILRQPDHSLGSLMEWMADRESVADNDRLAVLKTRNLENLRTIMKEAGIK